MNIHYSSLFHYLLVLAVISTNGQFRRYNAVPPPTPSLQTTGFLPGIGTYLAYNNYVRHTRQIDNINNPPPVSEEEKSKCTYVQMKGAGLPGSECQEGGMACDKECGLVDSTNEVENGGNR